MLTGVVLAHNEQENLAKCLDPLKFCDEILVIDDNSTDNTIKIAKQHGAKFRSIAGNDILSGG